MLLFARHISSKLVIADAGRYKLNYIAESKKRGIVEGHDLDQPRGHGSDQAKAAHAFDCSIDPHLACKMEREGQFQEKE
ncbi:hypothetical protein T07_8649 [Trichinella nelsoni]|uniref:Uncharacterized protein n=1 Tax=Trichinella nelsoni TaxID=6336 RepID=A0A0V0SB77_9BILA|nr:hypothetical protein T07_8649 [Trichinella nelsoni]